MWVLLAIFGAFFQALGAGIKKKALQASGLNNTIGFVSFMVAALLFGLAYFVDTGTLWYPELSARFWQGMFWYSGLNIIAVWFMYRALDSAEFNYLMPFMTLTSLSIVVPPIFLLGEIPSPLSFVGIALIVAGVLFINYRPKKDQVAKDTLLSKGNRRGVLYFIVTALCFTMTPTVAKIAIQESSALFASFLVHLLIGLGFLGIMLISRESKRVLAIVRDAKWRQLAIAVVLAGLVIFLENGSINLALAKAPVAYVMALKRLMPVFAFLIGLLYFKERSELPKKIIATTLMVFGAIAVTVFK